MTSLIAQLNPPDLTAVSGYVAAIGFGIWAAMEKIKSSKVEKKTADESETLSDAKAFQARAEVMTKLAEDNLILYTREHEAHEKTRDYWHTKASEFQDTLSKCQEKLQELQQRPDFTDVVQFIKEQSETSLQILRGISEILKAMKQKVEQ